MAVIRNTSQGRGVGVGVLFCVTSLLLRLLNQRDVIYCWTQRSIPSGSTLWRRLGAE